MAADSIRHAIQNQKYGGQTSQPHTLSRPTFIFRACLK